MEQNLIMNTYFTCGYNSGGKTPNILTSWLYKVTKSAISPQRKLRSLWNSKAHKIVIEYEQNFDKDQGIDVRALVVNARTHISSQMGAFMICAQIFMNILLVVDYILMSLSFKFHKDQSRIIVV